MPHIPGQWFHQANDVEHHELYYTSMLALLKLWHNIVDIKHSSDSFSTTFDNFVAHASENIKHILTNIQYFHNCADKARSE
jgi:hypothetical protein